jgi:hypothetical protein
MKRRDFIAALGGAGGAGAAGGDACGRISP